MNRLIRTRSQHFVGSPRKTASPLKPRYSITTAGRYGKRRRVGSSALAARPINAIDTEDEDTPTSDSSSEAESSTTTRRRHTMPLSSEIGSQMINRPGRLLRRSREHTDVKGKSKARPLDVFELEEADESSPRKRKRRDETWSDTSSWVEMDEDETEPEYIADSDQHLLRDAPAYALLRLRKAELIRLWKVAGMWELGDDWDSISTGDEDADGGMGKKDLVDGLIAARATSSQRPSPGPSPRKAALEAAFEIKRLSGTTSSVPVSPPSSSSSNSGTRSRLDTDATPRAIVRTRSRVRDDPSLLRSVTRKQVGAKEKRLRRTYARSKNLGAAEARKARFGDDVKSPANGLLRHVRRSSTNSSAYTTTDSDPHEPTTRQTPRRLRKPSHPRGYTPARRLESAKARTSGSASADEETVDGEIEETDEEADPTPLIQRLRPRTRSFLVAPLHDEAEADAEDEAEDDASPGPSSRTRARDRTNSDASMMSIGESRMLPSRAAKAKAKGALKDIESDEDGMDLDFTGNDDLVEEPEAIDEDASRPSSGHLTRAQARASRPGSADNKSPSKRHTRCSSRTSPIVIDDSSSDESSLTTLPNGSADEDEAVRTTRSGKAFGVMQTRKKRLRQEAIDDPDMEVEDEDDEDEDEEEDDESFEADFDLSEATVTSLTRLLRDELVQMCEARGIEVGGTKPQLARALLEWRDEQQMTETMSTTSSQATARPSPPPTGKIIHAVGSHVHVSGKATPVLLRDHVHAADPATPPPSDESKRANEAELNLDLAELGLEDSMIKPEQLVKLEKIGSGGFKDVYVGKYRGRKVAVSEFREHLSEMDIRELKLLAEFSHPNIVRFRGICIPDDNGSVPCMLVSELCENGDLFDYIRNVPTPSLKRLLGLMLDIARGLEYLHTRKPSIIHRDCKSSNILINRAGQAKVGDFGLARVKRSTRSMIKSLVGTVNWQAPELWHPAPRYDYKVDVFSAAMVYWEMMSGWIGEKKYPWEGHNEHYIYDAVGSKQRRPSIAGLRKHWGVEPVNLMERMWHQDPAERPTMTDVVADLEALLQEC